MASCWWGSVTLRCMKWHHFIYSGVPPQVGCYGGHGLIKNNWSKNMVKCQLLPLTGGEGGHQRRYLNGWLIRRVLTNWTINEFARWRLCKCTWYGMVWYGRTRSWKYSKGAIRGLSQPSHYNYVGGLKSIFICMARLHERDGQLEKWKNTYTAYNDRSFYSPPTFGQWVTFLIIYTNIFFDGSKKIERIMVDSLVWYGMAW